MSVSVVVPISGQHTSFFDSLTGVPTFSQSGLRTGGGDTLAECIGSGSAACWFGMSHPASTRILVESFYVLFTATPSGTVAFYSVQGPTQNPTLRITNAAKMNAFTGSGTGANSPTLSANTWYRIDTLVDTSTGTTSINWWLDGIPQGAATVTQSAVDITSSRCGNTSTTVAGTIRIMDWVTSYVSGDAPLGQHICKIYFPTGIGTHVVATPTSEFKKTGAVAVDGTDTNSYLDIDEMPPSNTDFVEQTVISTTHYLEYTVADTAEVNSPVVVCYVAGYQGSGTGVYTFQIRPYDGTTEDVDFTSGTKSAATARFSKKQSTITPTGASWSQASFNAMRLRFGYSSDVTPNPMLNSMGIIAAHPFLGPNAIGATVI